MDTHPKEEGEIDHEKELNFSGSDNSNLGNNDAISTDVKEVIELDLEVNGQMDDGEYDHELSDSEDEKDNIADPKQESDKDEEEKEFSGNLSTGYSYKNIESETKLLQLTPSQEDTRISNSNILKSKEPLIDLETSPSDPKDIKGTLDNNVTEDASDTDTYHSTHYRKDQEVQSSISEFEGDLLNYSYTEIYGKESMINALFNKSPVPHDKPESSEIQVTIFLPTNQSITKYYQANTNVIELKSDIGALLNQNADVLLISLMGDSKGEYINDWTPLLGIPPNSVGGLILNLSFKHDITIQSNIKFPSVETYAPIITVRRVPVEDVTGVGKIVTVVTEDISYVKEWLGGFRNVKTGQMYHNAATETNFWDRRPKTISPIDISTRDAQTHLPYTTKHTQVDANKATQMSRPDHYILSAGDKIITARPYIEFDLQNEQQERLGAATKIQKWYRRLLVKQNVRRAFTKLIELIRKQREKRTAAEAAMTQEKIHYLMGISFPTTRNDFFNLYSVIGIWWRKEYEQISKIESLSEKRAAVYDLLQDEIELLAALERQRIKSKKEALKRRSMKLLEETSRPIIRHQRKKNMTIIDTLEVQRAREIKEVYTTYTRKDLDKKERIQVVLSLVNLLETFEEVDYTKDLIMLMKREVDMISMGINHNYLLGLRKRIEEGLMHFVRDEEFNPQVKNVRPLHYTRVNQRSYRCKGCRKLKNAADFPIHVRLVSYIHCRSCVWIHQTAHSVLNISPYASILKLLRAREIIKCPQSTYCFILQPLGAYFIINTIWNGKSAISESMNLKELRLCRWDNKEEWTPWNAILLTVDEAEIHERILNNDDVYESEFIQSINIKHITAKFHFKVLDETDIYCRETGLWDTAIDENIYQHIFRRRETLQFEDPFFKDPPPKYFVKTPQQYKKLECTKPKGRVIMSSSKS